MIHQTAIIDTAITNIGTNTNIWAFSHICEGAIIGDNCTIGEGVYIGPNVTIGNNCKIQNHSLIYEGVVIGDNVFIGPNVVTTNDNFPRATGDWSDRFMKTFIKSGVSVCANTTIICGITLNENCMIGAGSTVTQSIESNYIAYGTPAKCIRKIS